jgi:hypothetical protein
MFSFFLTPIRKFHFFCWKTQVVKIVAALCTFPQKMFSWKIDCSWNDHMFLICTRPINLNHTLLCFSATIFTTWVFQQKKWNFLIGVRNNENMHQIFPQHPLLYQILTETQFPSPLKPGYHSKHFKKLPEVA